MPPPIPTELREADLVTPAGAIDRMMLVRIAVQRARREAMGGLRPGRETRASDGCNQRHEDDDKDHAHGQERQRLDVRQAIAGAYEAGAPEQNENDRSSRDRQLREARWFWRHRGFADGGRRHAYTIFYAAFPCPLFPDEPLSTCRMGAASGLRKI